MRISLLNTEAQRFKCWAIKKMCSSLVWEERFVEHFVTDAIEKQLYV